MDRGGPQLDNSNQMYSQVRSKQQQLEEKLDSVMKSLESVVAKLT